jgi:hypothetical protein
MKYETRREIRSFRFIDLAPPPLIDRFDGVMKSYIKRLEYSCPTAWIIQMVMCMA